MKLTKSQLKQIIKEELLLFEQAATGCAGYRFPDFDSGSLKYWKVKGFTHEAWPRIINVAGKGRSVEWVWGVRLPGKRVKWMATNKFMEIMKTIDCSIPTGVQIYRLYRQDSSTPCTRKVLGKCSIQRNVTRYFRIEEPEREEEEFPEDLRFDDPEGLPTTIGRTPGNCGPRPPLGADWKSRPATDPRRIAFRKWLDCRKGRRTP